MEAQRKDPLVLAGWAGTLGKSSDDLNWAVTDGKDYHGQGRGVGISMF